MINHIRKKLRTLDWMKFMNVSKIFGMTFGTEKPLGKFTGFVFFHTKLHDLISASDVFFIFL
jgi:hypothetical protein